MEPVPPLQTGRVPVTPVVKGKPVAFVSVRLLGVPRLLLQLPSPRQNVEDDAPTPELRFATGTLPSPIVPELVMVPPVRGVAATTCVTVPPPEAAIVPLVMDKPEPMAVTLPACHWALMRLGDRKSTRLNSSH